MKLTIEELTKAINEASERVERDKNWETYGDGGRNKKSFLDGMRYATFVADSAETIANRPATTEGTFQGILDARSDDQKIKDILKNCECDFQVEISKRHVEKKTITVTVSGEVSDVEFILEIG